LITEANKGGNLIHDGVKANVTERGIAYFDATKPHEVSPVETGERVVFVFEFD
jgi:hypothetical protein